MISSAMLIGVTPCSLNLNPSCLQSSQILRAISHQQCSNWYLVCEGRMSAGWQGLDSAGQQFSVGFVARVGEEVGQLPGERFHGIVILKYSEIIVPCAVEQRCASQSALSPLLVEVRQESALQVQPGVLVRDGELGEYAAQLFRRLACAVRWFFPVALRHFLEVLAIFDVSMVRSVPTVLAQKQLYQLLRPILREILREDQLFLLHGEEDIVRVVAVPGEGQVANCHLIENDSKRPIVGREGIAEALLHLRRQVMRRSDDREGLEALSSHLFGQHEGNKARVCVSSNQDILRLQIAVQDLLLMEKLDQVDQVLSDEVDGGLREEVDSLHECVEGEVEVLAIEEVDVGAVLEGPKDVDHVFMRKGLVELSIIGQQSLPLVLDDLTFGEGKYGVVGLSAALADQVAVREVRAFFLADQIEVLERHVSLIAAERKPQRRRVDNVNDGPMLDGKHASFGPFGERVYTFERRVVILVDQAADPLYFLAFHRQGLEEVLDADLALQANHQFRRGLARCNDYRSVLHFLDAAGLDDFLDLLGWKGGELFCPFQCPANDAVEDDVPDVLGLDAEEELVPADHQAVGAGDGFCLPAAGRVRLETALSEDVSGLEHNRSAVWHLDLDFSILDEVDAVGHIAQVEYHCILLEAGLVHVCGQRFLLRSGQPAEDWGAIDVVEDEAVAVPGQLFHLALQVLLAERDELALRLSHGSCRPLSHVDQRHIAEDAALSQHLPHQPALSLQLDTDGASRDDEGEVGLIIYAEDVGVGADLEAFHGGDQLHPLVVGELIEEDMPLEDAAELHDLSARQLVGKRLKGRSKRARGRGGKVVDEVAALTAHRQFWNICYQKLSYRRGQIYCPVVEGKLLVSVRCYSVNSYFQFYQPVSIDLAMSQQSFRLHRCRTELAHPPEPSSLRLKCHSHQPPREPLNQQAKFINPYSKDKTHKKSILRFQEPHSIVLLQRRHQKTASEARINAYVSADQPGQEKYKVESVIGKGCNSTVFEGFWEGDSQRVAIKKIIMDTRGERCRQAELMHSLDHPNVVKLKEQYETIDRGRKFQCLVMERFDCDLAQLIRQKWLPQDEVKSYVYQILAGLEYLHRESVVHRDLKPANIFVNRREKRAVLGDLGSAKRVSLGESVSGEPCPFGYRAPELLFGANNYSHSADVWSFACLLLELATGKSPFKASSSTELLMQVINWLGTPSVQQICEMDPSYNPRSYEQLPKVRPKRDGMFSSHHQLNDLLKKIFVYSPEQRITAFEALQHDYFKETRTEESLRTEESQTTPKHKRDRSNLNTVASLEDQTARSTNAVERPRQTLLKAYLGKIKAQHPLARKLAF